MSYPTRGVCARRQRDTCSWVQRFGGHQSANSRAEWKELKKTKEPRYMLLWVLQTLVAPLSTAYTRGSQPRVHVVEIRVLLPRRLNVFIAEGLLLPRHLGAVAFVCHGEFWAGRPVVVATACSWRCSLFLQMVTAILCWLKPSVLVASQDVPFHNSIISNFMYYITIELKQIFIAAIRAPIQPRMVFYDLCYYFWGHHYFWTEKKHIQRFLMFRLPSNL